MEGSEHGRSFRENRSGSGNGLPPNPLAASYRKTFNSDSVSLSPCKKSLVRHPSLQMRTRVPDAPIEPIAISEYFQSDFIPTIRSGAWADIGVRSCMEDVYVCVDDFAEDFGLENTNGGPNAFYGVFDGHGGKHAADFAGCHLLRFILEDKEFPQEIEKVISSAFLRTDAAFAKACSLDAALASGTTALTAIIMGRLLVVANAGDCRAVLCRRGKAIEMSIDHKPIYARERERIEASGGCVSSDGYLNGHLNVARALGDWHMEGMKIIGSNSDPGPLIAEPELITTNLTEEDEFLIIGCDGIWDVFLSQNAVDFARRRLQEHNDPSLCSKDLVDEALKRKSIDNLAAIIICFQHHRPPNLVTSPPRVRRSFSDKGLRELQSFLDSLGGEEGGGRNCH
ncbi:hypothetical protein SAY87_023247 [Trapa incisa]|uniref:protein-serine/threonine phosphatase n=1 Tax=Trapa incisa TaxID=236973 RepID=A0AAN7K8W5_9MYRT|nr:hypothetical protein SAY87_023247 [Trapa incisa]